MQSASIRSGILLLAFAAMTYLVFAARSQLSDALLGVSTLMLCLVYIATLSQNVCLWLLFHDLADAKHRYLLTSQMFFVGQIAKYVPGKIWGVVYQTTLRNSCIPGSAIIQANVVVYAFTIVCVLAVCSAVLLAPTMPGMAVAVLLGGGLASIVVASSKDSLRFLRRYERFARVLGDPATSSPRGGARRVGWGVAYLVCCTAYISSNVFLIEAFFDLPLSETARMSALLGLAWIVGALVAVTPSGLGVREAAFIALGQLEADASLELFAGIAVVARVVQVIQDLLSAMLVPAFVRLLRALLSDQPA